MLILRTFRQGGIALGTIRRYDSTLAEKMIRAAEGFEVAETESQQRDRLEVEMDEKGEPFRELFVMPQRKLSAQMQLDKLTGRSKFIPYSRMDIQDRLAVRRPRSEEMSTEQDWPSVWPVAASFRSSVVPLPVKMGSRPHPDKRPPFQKLGNLELVKIPNFLHLTPAAIERHCKAIKKFCTAWPRELSESKNVVDEHFPVTVSYSDYVHQGTSLRDPRARIITIKMKRAALKMGKAACEKFMRLSGSRFDEANDTLTIVTDRCYTRKQNRDYAKYLLTALYHESIKQEAWEKLAQRTDDLKVKFEGSLSQKSVEEIVERLTNNEKSEANEPTTQLTDSETSRRKNVEDFAHMWEKYRNQEETPEAVKKYEECVRSLLGIPRFEDSAIEESK